MTPKLTPTDADREMAACLLDLISNLLGDDGIGQVADLIRDGEYDEHEALQLVAQHAATARAEERERCAREADYYAKYSAPARSIAAAIRKGSPA